MKKSKSLQSFLLNVYITIGVLLIIMYFLSEEGASFVENIYIKFLLFGVILVPVYRMLDSKSRKGM